MARQRRYFRNLVQLPLAKFRYRVLDEQWQGLRTPRAVGRGRAHPPGTADHAARGVRRRAGRAHRRFRVLLPQGTRPDRLGPDQRRQAALRGNAGAVGPDRDHRPRGTGCARRLRPGDQRIGRDRHRGGSRRHRRDRPRAPVHLVRPRGRLQRAEPPGARVVHRRAGRGARAPRRADLPDVRRERGPAGGLDADAGDAQLGGRRPAVPRPDHPPRAEPRRGRGPRRRCTRMGLRRPRRVPRRPRDPPARPDHPHLGAEPRTDRGHRDAGVEGLQQHRPGVALRAQLDGVRLHRGDPWRVPPVGAGRCDAQRWRGHERPRAGPRARAGARLRRRPSSHAAPPRGSATCTAEPRFATTGGHTGPRPTRCAH